jgi:hypothetical protein
LILCLGCRRLSPKGTAWCGTCRATLGRRTCPDGHASPVHATCCAVCGSAKLSKGSGAVNLRPLSWLAVLGLAWATLPCLIRLAEGGTSAAQRWFWGYAADRLVVAAFLFWLVGRVLGEKVRDAFLGLVLAAASCAVALLGSAGRAVSRLAGR